MSHITCIPFINPKLLLLELIPCGRAQDMTWGPFQISFGSLLIVTISIDFVVDHFYPQGRILLEHKRLIPYADKVTR